MTSAQRPEEPGLSSKAYLAWLNTKIMGLDPRWLTETTSTNDWIAARLAEPGVERIVAEARRQTHGRGRMGREWISPPGVNLAFSLAWPAPPGLAQPGVITLAAGVALAEAVEDAFGCAPTLKYPNDLYLDEKKAGGILTELKGAGARKFAVMGFGLNLNTTEAMFTGELAGSATSIFIHTGKKVERERALAAIINKLEPALELLAKGGLKDIMDRYRRLAAPLFGRRVHTAGEYIGAAEGITDGGELMVRAPDGRLLLVTGGEVTFRAE